MEGKNFKHLLLYLTVGGVAVLMLEYAFIILNLGSEVIDIRKFIIDAKLTGYSVRAFVIGTFFAFGFQEAIIKVKINRKKRSLLAIFSLVTFGITTGVWFTYIDQVPYLGEYCQFTYIPVGVTALILLHNIAQMVAPGLNLSDKKQDLSTVNEKKLVQTGAFYFPTVGGGGFPVNNIYRSLLLNGSAGSGKTASWYHWALIMGIQQNHSGILYDFKREFLDYAYNVLKYFNSKLNFKVIDFIDLKRSHRVNPIHPESLKNNAHIQSFITAYMLNLQKDWIKKKDFWATGTIGLVTGATIFLKNNHPEYCTIPHLNEFLLKLKAEEMVKLIKQDVESEAYVAGIAEAVGDKNSGAQVSGILQTVRDSIAPMAFPELYWILTGHDFDLHLNNPDNPTLLCLRSSQGLRDQLGPVNALIFTVAIKQMIRDDQNPSLLYMDEAPTFYIPKIEEIPEVARSAKIGLLYGEQDLSAKDRVYGKEIRTGIMGAIANKAFGQTSETDTIKYVSDLFGTHEVIKRRVNTGTSDNLSSTNYSSGENYDLKDEKIIRNTDMLDLDKGEFFCNLVESEKKGSLYKGRIILPEVANSDYKQFKEKHTVPEFIHGVDENLVYENFLQVKKDIETLRHMYF